MSSAKAAETEKAAQPAETDWQRAARLRLQERIRDTAILSSVVRNGGANELCFWVPVGPSFEDVAHALENVASDIVRAYADLPNDDEHRFFAEFDDWKIVIFGGIGCEVQLYVPNFITHWERS